MFLSWLPIIGNVFDGIFGYLNKKADVQVQNKKIDADTRKTEIDASVDTLRIFQDNITLSISRDLIVFMTSLYTALTVWDYMVVTKYPQLVWGTKAIPVESGLSFLPYAVLVFLLGNLYLNKKQV